MSRIPLPSATALSHVSVQSIVNLQHFSCTGCIEARVLWRNAEALSRVSVQSTPTVPNLPPSSPPTSPQVLELPVTTTLHTMGTCSENLHRVGNTIENSYSVCSPCSPALLSRLPVITLSSFLFFYYGHKFDSAFALTPWPKVGLRHSVE